MDFSPGAVRRGLFLTNLPLMPYSLATSVPRSYGDSLGSLFCLWVGKIEPGEVGNGELDPYHCSAVKERNTRKR